MEDTDLPAVVSERDKLVVFGLESGRSAVSECLVTNGWCCEEVEIEKGGFFGGRAPLGPDPNHQLLFFFLRHSAIQAANNSFFSGGT